MLVNDVSNIPAITSAHERLTWNEICQRYPEEWVVLVAIERADEADEADDVAIEF
ncbi:MAG TPA: hypothetical protein VHN14_17015 [Kofleriaceae bacterium]|jgi:hypothetical protein|nr:hypothetical protein [Kofleriaceae bacterium]